MKLNNRKLKKEINQKGYTVIENFYNKKKLSEIKKSLLDMFFICVKLSLCLASSADKSTSFFGYVFDGTYKYLNT